MSPAPGKRTSAFSIWPRRILAWVCGAILLVLMTLTVVDVIGRYIFNAPLIGSTELTEVLLVSVIFIGLPAVCMDDEHVTVDLVTSQMPAWVHPFRKALLALISATIFGVISWRLWIYGSQIAGYHGVTNSLRIPVGPFAWLCSVCAAVAVVITLYVAARDLRRALRA
ncbi:TRAP transporter small permease [Pseudooceanicola sediminis]|uniref:TRAP transporter small permease protein n=1 Tax=Pseudooceanicola sediminis TaxID=2211117 RepID=A0A399J2F0_9RHOB|nr:TRAP transporter small permease [Pseudooceanicola sediminis]KAA2313953.1 TRAP transporter small permease [Puniceibacterium sp. HSS470]RII38817.1 TRAP transporter small permease [Pseudooceanicola sediminis]|tara:strand:+ start:81958 stop:82461 length:504 start_codon:yes stop_codon:yes gene_type:complete